jgi:hypothetical protein
MWIITAWQHISSVVNVTVLRSAMYLMHSMRLIMTCCGIKVKRMGMSEDSVRKMKALTVTVILTGKGG